MMLRDISQWDMPEMIPFEGTKPLATPVQALPPLEQDRFGNIIGAATDREYAEATVQEKIAYDVLSKGFGASHTTYIDPEQLVKDPSTDPPETVCQEAQRIVYGDREKTYGHPSLNFERTAQLWNAHLVAKYGLPGPGAPVGGYVLPQLDTEDVAWMMLQLKQARDIHAPKRDNIVDAIGYAACIQKMRDHV